MDPHHSGVLCCTSLVCFFHPTTFSSFTYIHLCYCFRVVADAKAAIQSAELELGSARTARTAAAKKLVATLSESSNLEKTISQQKNVIKQEEAKIAKQKAQAAEALKREKERLQKAAEKQKQEEKKAAKRAKEEKKRLEEQVAKKAKQLKKQEQEKAKKQKQREEKARKEAEKIAQRKKEAMEQEEKVKKEVAQRKKEAMEQEEKAKKDAAQKRKKKEVAAKEKRISDLKKIRNNIKKGGGTAAELKSMDARIQAEQDLLFNLKAK